MASKTLQIGELATDELAESLDRVSRNLAGVSICSYNRISWIADHIKLSLVPRFSLSNFGQGREPGDIPRLAALSEITVEYYSEFDVTTSM